MDPNGSQVYAVGIHYIIVVDIETRTGRIFGRDDVFGLGPVGAPYLEPDVILTYPKAMSISKDHRLYVVGQRFYNFQFLAYLHELDFSNLNHNRVRLVSALELSTFNFGDAAIYISRFTMMSIFLDEEQQTIIIGISHVNTILLLSYNGTHSPQIIKRHESSNKGVSFGKSVVLFHDKSYAVLAYAQSTLPWSTSQVQVYSLDDESSQPMYVFPNNQQVIRTMNLVKPPYGILTLVSHRKNLALVVEAGGFLLLPSSPPGYCSCNINDNLFYAGNYTPLLCPSGTARSTSSFGPCEICPPGTKNNERLRIDCQPCSKNTSVVCLRGTKTEIELNRVSSFDQANPYPDSPGTTEFDDILLQNIFIFSTKSGHCLSISPLFWATLTTGFSFIIFVIISAWTCSPKRISHRSLLKKIFTRFDLIGQGESWFGGVVSLVIVILIGFTWKFSVSFSHLYPIEKISQETRTPLSCHLNLINSKFTSALRLLSIHKHEEEQPIFKMLDEQNITLLAEFVSTSFSCESVAMQRTMYKGQQISSPDFDCIVYDETNILSVSTLLPQHLIAVQFSLNGSSFVGGLRLCFTAPSMTQSNGKYTVLALNFCHFFFTPNETLTTHSIISLKMTKSINRTAPLSLNNDMILTGLWLYTFTVNTLADALFFEHGGNYRRYLSDRVMLTVDLTESEFYMENNQEPIARQNEIIFLTVLFSILCLELFGLLFLLFKLVIHPLVRIIAKRYFHQCRVVSPTEYKEHSQRTQFIEQRMDEAIKEWESKKTNVAECIQCNILPLGMGNNDGTNQSNERNNTLHNIHTNIYTKNVDANDK